MKKVYLLIAFVGLMAASPFVKAQEAPREIQIGIADAYIPSGYTPTSNITVVANGLFPNGCYRWSRAEVTHPSAFVHEVRTFAKVQQGMCLMVLVPFNREISLGQLGTGNHVIKFIGGDGTYLEKTLQL